MYNLIIMKSSTEIVIFVYGYRHSLFSVYLRHVSVKKLLSYPVALLTYPLSSDMKKKLERRWKFSNKPLQNRFYSQHESLYIFFDSRFNDKKKSIPCDFRSHPLMKMIGQVV